MIRPILLCSVLFSPLGASALEVRDSSGKTVPVSEDGALHRMTEYRAGMNWTVEHWGQRQSLRFANPQDVVTLRFSQGKKRARFTIHPLPKDFPKFEFHGKSTIDRPVIFSVSEYEVPESSACHLFILGPDGQLRFYRRLSVRCTDFRPHVSGGKRYYSYQETREGISNVGFFGGRVLLSEDMQEYQQVKNDSDHHEFLLLGANHWIQLSTVIGRLKSGMPYLDKRVREVQEGRIVFDWGVSDFMEQMQTEAGLQITLFSLKREVVAEIMHLNSIQQIGSDGLLLGLGGNGVAFVDKKTRSVRWVLGGLNDQFGLDYEQHPHFHHMPHFDPATGVLHVFSNFSPKTLEKGFGTRILRYELDVARKKVISFKVLRDVGEVASLLGSLQVVGNTLSIGYGVRKRGKHDFLELTDGKPTAWLRFSNPRQSAYRFYREPYGD